MRLWSIHPKYLDSKGLVALWREALLAQKVLKGQTTGYKRHPQLNRFKSTLNPVSAIATYLSLVQIEASSRGFKFDANKIIQRRTTESILISDGQLIYEMGHLKNKLLKRDRKAYEKIQHIGLIEAHPLFKIFQGKVAEWEIV